MSALPISYLEVKYVIIIAIIISIKLGLIDNSESVQRRATKLIPKLKNIPYNDKLKILQLPTLTNRRYRDVIEVYRINMVIQIYQN